MPTQKTRSRIVIAAVVCTLAVGTPTAYAALDEGQAPAPNRESSAATSGKPYIDTHLYFGAGRDAGEPPVSDKEFYAFVDKHVTPVVRNERFNRACPPARHRIAPDAHQNGR